MKNKRGTILVENIIFIVLNLIFLVILTVFLVSRMSSGFVLEEKYAKQIALILDSAKPGMIISLNMEDAIGKLEKNFDRNNMVKIDENIVTVKLRDKGGYSYSFFNDIHIENTYPDGNNLVLVLDRYNNENGVQDDSGEER